MRKTLYNLTKEEARTLMQFCGWDIGAVGILLWNRHIASSIPKGVKMAKKLKNFAGGVDV